MKNEKKVALRRIVEADLPIRVKWMNDSRVYASMGFIPPISLENTLSWYRAINKTEKRHDFTVVNNEREIVAFGGLTGIDNKTRKAEFYIFVNPEAQGLGYGSLATHAICRYGFSVLGLHKIFLLTNASNTPAQHLYEKLGFKLEGRHRHERVHNEVFEDRLYYGLLLEDFDIDCNELRLCGESGINSTDDAYLSIGQE